MTQFWLTDLAYESTCHEVLAREAGEVLGERGVVRITGFPDSAAVLISFLGHLGTPLGYYGGDAGTHPDHNAIWRVAYDRDASQRGETHAIAGPLAVHSSQSLLDPRPRYFCMLMANPGWQDLEPGMNGESLLVPWSRTLRLLAEENPDEYGKLLDTLMSPVPYPDGLTRPLVYELNPMRERFDYGVRLKSDLLTTLKAAFPDEDVTHLMEKFAAAGQRAAKRVQLAAGDLVVVDNDRWGHGRESVIGRRRAADGSWTVNPRELWSLTLA